MSIANKNNYRCLIDALVMTMILLMVNLVKHLFFSDLEEAPTIKTFYDQDFSANLDRVFHYLYL